jgi:ligand-binding sensor protein
MNDYWMGRDPATLIGQVQEEYADTGYSISVVVDAHLTSIANLSNVLCREFGR